MAGAAKRRGADEVTAVSRRLTMKGLQAWAGLGFSFREMGVSGRLLPEQEGGKF